MSEDTSDGSEISSLNRRITALIHEHWEKNDTIDALKAERSDQAIEIGGLSAELAVLKASRSGETMTPDHQLDTLISLAESLAKGFECKSPQNGAPGYPHCAACCGGTRIEASCVEEFDFAVALNNLVAAGRRYQCGVGPEEIK